MMIERISRRLHEVNTLLGTRVEGGLSFEQALPPSLFYRDFSDTNRIVGEAEAWAEKDMEQLMYFSSSLLSEAGTYLSLDRSALLSADFEALFEEHIKPFELRYGEAQSAATQLWRDYSTKSSRLDSLPLDSDEYRSLDAECGAAKAEYDKAHALVTLLYQEWQQERDRCLCVYCFKPVFMDVLVERLKGIAGSFISDINRMKEDKP